MTLRRSSKNIGYVINPADDIMYEVEGGSLAISDDKLHAFLHRPDEEYSEEEVLKMLKERSGLFLPGWFALDEGFYGLLLPTMMNIAEALD